MVEKVNIVMLLVVLWFLYYFKDSFRIFGFVCYEIDYCIRRVFLRFLIRVFLVLRLFFGFEVGVF